MGPFFSVPTVLKIYRPKQSNYEETVVVEVAVMVKMPFTYVGHLYILLKAFCGLLFPFYRLMIHWNSELKGLLGDFILQLRKTNPTS